MMPVAPERDLVVLAADGQMKEALDGLLARPLSLSIRRVTHDCYVHPQRDPGVYFRGAELLAALVSQYRFALVILDLEWAGSPMDSVAMAAKIRQDLQRHGWQDRSEVIVINPELDVWVWSDSAHVPRVLNTTWHAIRRVARDKGYWPEGELKPRRPKELLEAVLREAGVARSGAIYRSLAQSVGLARCTDRAFLTLKGTLQTWFPSEAAEAAS